MTPKCCQKCSCLTEDGDCSSFGKRCERWRHWFRREWTKIQKAAGIACGKANEKENAEK